MATATTKLMTAEEFYDWANDPDNRDKYCELERGEIVEMSRPGKLHGLVCANCVLILGGYARQHQHGYVCSNDTGIITERDPDTVRGPDVMLFDDVDDYNEVDLKYGENPPLLAVEVLSPNDTMGKVTQRVLEQLAFGAKLIWVLDPVASNVMVFRPEEPTYVVKTSEELTGDDVLPQFRCPVAEFFALPGKKPAAKPTSSKGRKKRR
jgi:Uma2 family endonuclease